MQDMRIFGNISEKITGKVPVKRSHVAKWRFVGCDGIDLAIDPEERDEYVTEIPFEHLKEFQKEVAEAGEEISVDMPLIALHGAGHSTAASGGFGTRRNALNLLGLGNDPDAGDDVGVIILDAGINRDYIESIAGPGRYGGGWTNQPPAQSDVGRMVDPHLRAADLHGNMIARNILSVAPKATLYDAPILPPRVFSLKRFSSDAAGALRAIRRVIKNRHNNPNFPTHKHWILVNAWAVATSFADFGQTFSYVDDRQHRLNRRIIRLAEMDNVDVIFAAGNSGAFQPARFSGPYDRGHARSIWGSNGLEEVFTIGAVRTDNISIGASSQGPSLSSLLIAEAGHNKKPDLCAPSWFSEDTDPSIINSGTSAACAVFAGLLTRIRTDAPATPSDSIKSILINNAVNDGEWRAQRGYGMPI